MQVSLSATGGLERRLEVAVPATEVSSEVEQRLKQISRTARLKGFRPGKAPYSVVRKQFGDQVHTEVVSDLMRSSFAQALSQEADTRGEPAHRAAGAHKPRLRSEVRRGFRGDARGESVCGGRHRDRAPERLGHRG